MVSQGPLTQHNPHAKVTHFGEVCSEPLITAREFSLCIWAKEPLI